MCSHCFLGQERGMQWPLLFIPGTWQDNLNEQQSAQVVQATLPVLSCHAASQVHRVMAGKADTLTLVAHVEVAGLLSLHDRNAVNFNLLQASSI